MHYTTGHSFCPQCNEPLAPKSMSVACGSCGHDVPLRQTCGGLFTSGRGFAIFAAMILAMGGFAWVESARYHESVTEVLAKRVREEAAKRRNAETKLGEVAREMALQKAKAISAARQQEELRERLIATMQPRGDAGGSESSTSADAGPSGLQEGLDEEIRFLEARVARASDDAEAHFRLSLAYDRSEGPDWSAKSFQHAKAAIKLDPAYKVRFQPMIRNSRVAKNVAKIIHEIIQKSEESSITDAEAARYAEEIGKILGSSR